MRIHKYLIAAFFLPYLLGALGCSKYPGLEEWGLYYCASEGKLVKLVTVDFRRFHKTSIGLSSWIREQYPFTVREERPTFLLYVSGASSSEAPRSPDLLVEKLNLVEIPPEGEKRWEGGSEIPVSIIPISDLHHKILPPWLTVKLLPKNKFLFKIEGGLRHNHYYSIYFSEPYSAGWNFKVKLPSPQLPPDFPLQSPIR